MDTFWNKNNCPFFGDVRFMEVRDAIHTHFVTLMGKLTIVGGWVKHRADKRGKVGRIEL